MEMKILVQGRGKLDAKEVAEFIESCPEAKVALVHTSLRDEVALMDFFKYLTKNQKTPFVGIRVSGFATQEGYCEDGVAVAVLCGDFEAEVVTEKINYDDLEETADKITNQLEDKDLFLAYGANYYKQNTYLDYLL